jgi:hypothetical protein
LNIHPLLFISFFCGVKILSSYSLYKKIKIKEVIIMNRIVITLAILLILSINPVNAYNIPEPTYEIFSHDVTVNPGETTTIAAELWRYSSSQKSHYWIRGAVLVFTVKDKNGNILATETATTKGSWWEDPRAVCRINTVYMPIGNHTVTISCYMPEKGVYKTVTKDYEFNII